MVYDYLIVGSGIAGLYFALKAKEKGAKVLIITKNKLDDTNTNFAQGGIAAVQHKKDSIWKHYQDTISAGSGSNNKRIVHYHVKKAPNFISELQNYEVNFEKGDDGNLKLTKEGGHSNRRIVYSKDITGKEVQMTLMKRVKEENINIMENVFAIDLIKKIKFVMVQ